MTSIDFVSRPSLRNHWITDCSLPTVWGYAGEIDSNLQLNFLTDSWDGQYVVLVQNSIAEGY